MFVVNALFSIAADSNLGSAGWLAGTLTTEAHFGCLKRNYDRV
jgi:hypothetical protein